MTKSMCKPLEEVAPGNLLQLMHLKRRIKNLQVQHGTRALWFLDAGAGKGHVSNFLLQLGLSGIGCDLNAESCARSEALNAGFIASGCYRVVPTNFLDYDFGSARFDVVLSSMVLAHLPADDVHRYFTKFRELLTHNGVIISIVPGSKAHRGIEDQAVGHYRRYSIKDFEEICAEHGLKLRHVCGLTYPISNWLLPLSNALILARDDKRTLDLPMNERTKLSGNRHVRMKNIFPWYFRIVLNQVTMLPFDILQRVFRKHPSSLVIYSEIGLPQGQ